MTVNLDLAFPQAWLVRHGETDWSREGRHTSTTDLALTPGGEQVAAGLGERLAPGEHEFALVLTSPRQRARRTAELAGFPDAQVDEDLSEWAYGEYEGLTTAEIRERVPDWTIWSDACPGGETAEHVAQRLDRVIARVAAAEGDVLLFSHAHALRALAARWLGQSVSAGRLLRLDTATISVLGHERSQRVIERWNS